MLCFCLKIFSVSFCEGAKKTGVFEAVELYPYGIARLAELCFELAQVRAGAVVQEEFQQELDAGFRCYKRFEQGYKFRVIKVLVIFGMAKCFWEKNRDASRHKIIPHHLNPQIIPELQRHFVRDIVQDAFVEGTDFFLHRAF